MPKLPSISRSQNYLVLEIKNFRNQYSLNTLNFSSINIDEDMDNLEKSIFSKISHAYKQATSYRIYFYKPNSRSRILILKLL